MNIGTVDYVAVVVAAVVGYAFGAGYYWVLSKQWQSAVGKTADQIRASMSAVPFIIGGVGQLVMAFVLCWFIVRLGATTPFAGVKVGAWAWLGFVLASMAVSHGFSGARRQLTVIDSGHWLGVLVIQGFLIGLIAG